MPSPQNPRNMRRQLKLSGPLQVRLKHRTFLQDEETFATPLILILLDCFGTESLEWTPETIKAELEETYSVTVPDQNIDKIMAGVMLLTTNYFYQSVTSFIHICNVLAGNDFDPTEFDPADPFEMMLAINEAFLLWPPTADDDATQFSPEIQEYIRQVLDAEGVLRPVDVFQIAMQQDRTSQIAETYSDDPEMFAAVFQTQQEKTGELGAAYMSAIQELTEQLEELTLANGSTDELVARLRKGMQMFAERYLKEEETI